MLLHVVGSLSFKIPSSCQIELIKIKREREIVMLVMKCLGTVNKD